jgi:hypothetical protein
MYATIYRPGLLVELPKHLFLLTNESSSALKESKSYEKEPAPALFLWLSSLFARMATLLVRMKALRERLPTLFERTSYQKASVTYKKERRTALLDAFASLFITII